jgi:hypothetical protein
MQIDASKMNDEELMAFFNSWDEKNFQQLCCPIHGLVALVKGGWRDPYKIPLHLLKNAALSYSRGHNGPRFIQLINSNLQEWDAETERIKDDCLEQGIDEASAYAAALYGRMSSKFRVEYLHLKGFAPDFEDAINKAVSQIALIERFTNKKDTIAAAEERIGKNAGTIQEVNKKATENSDVIASLKQANLDLSQSLEKVGKQCQDLSERLTRIENDSTEADIRQRVELIGKKEAELEKRADSLVAAQQSLTDRIERQATKEQPTPKNDDTKLESKFAVELIPQGSSDSDDGSNLADIIGDVSFGLLSNVTKSSDHYPFYRSFVLDALYSDRLLFAAKEKANHLAKVLSGILSGQGYCHISCDGNVTPQELFQFVSKRIKDGSFTVFLIDGFFGRDDFSATAKKLRLLHEKSKFIFSINDAKSIKFLPMDVLDDFLFFDASINNAGRSAYVYVCQLPARAPSKDGSLTKCLNDLGITPSESAETVADGLGLIRYSYLPFLAYRDEKSLDDLASLIQTPELQSKISEAIDE